jgi:hypothetical protein
MALRPGPLEGGGHNSEPGVIWQGVPVMCVVSDFPWVAVKAQMQSIVHSMPSKVNRPYISFLHVWIPLHKQAHTG